MWSGLFEGMVGEATQGGKTNPCNINFHVESLVYPRLTHARSVVLHVCVRVECGDVCGMGLAAVAGKSSTSEAKAHRVVDCPSQPHGPRLCTIWVDTLTQALRSTASFSPMYG